MPPPYSSSSSSSNSYNGYGYIPPRQVPPRTLSSAAAPSFASAFTHTNTAGLRKALLNGDYQTARDIFLALLRSLLHRLWIFAKGPGRHAALTLAMLGFHALRRNLAPRRLLSFPHLLVAVWVIVLLWGEHWVFTSRVRSCDWDHWEKWPAGAQPHRLIFVADPQLIDPHSYPGRPWPLNPLTIQITDNYLRRAYTNLQSELRPDTVLFLGDLFDGGREWKTAHGTFEDPDWAKDHRPAREQKFLKEWHRKYGENFWLKEYKRFGDIFYDNWKLGGFVPGSWQRGKKIISSLPGNHDLGFGAEVKLPVRSRFNAYFGEGNRVDVIGNHSFVSVDTVSLSADTSDVRNRIDLSDIYNPVNEFLRDVKQIKHRAATKELVFWKGMTDELQFEHKVEELTEADYLHRPSFDLGGAETPDLPTVLLTHVPLYRDPGTPCGPMREHWPPAKPAKGQTGPVIPDHRNAISVSAGYQYQNVLNEEDSEKLIKSIGNVIYAFSGDDHDYCEVIHKENKENVHEITVKSLSMAMGVPTPGFQMVSLYNPIGEDGKPIRGAPKVTLQTHLCLLPKQLGTYATYAAFAVISIVLVVARALLVPVLHLQPFALDPSQDLSAPSLLPVFREKEKVDEEAFDHPTSSDASGTKLHLAPQTTARTRGQSMSNGLVSYARNASPKPPKHRQSHQFQPAGSNAWGWGSSDTRGPTIDIRRDKYHDNAKWRAAARSRSRFGLVGREIWTSAWRVIWMVVLFFAYLTYKG